MSNKILTKYINELISDSFFDMVRCDYVTKIRYLGDGQGDFEEIADDATEEVIIKYIEHCKQQIALANVELKKKTEERTARLLADNNLFQRGKNERNTRETKEK